MVDVKLTDVYWGAWINAMLISWLPIIVSGLFRHGWISLAIRVLAETWLIFNFYSILSDAPVMKPFAPPILIGGAVLSILLFAHTHGFVLAILILILAFLAITTPSVANRMLSDWMSKVFEKNPKK